MNTQSPIEFVTLDPAHFHAALLHKKMLSDVSRTVHVYAPPGPDVDMHLQRIRDYNTREVEPTSWDVRATIAPDYLSQFQRDRVGNAVVLAGRNRTKIDTLLACLEAGYHVLADKPWIIQDADFPKLERAVATAKSKKLVIHDMMTERFEITSELQQRLVNTPDIFGSLLPGTVESPSIRIESVHAIKKHVSGQPLRRPVSFFDIAEQGDALTDVGVHLVDLVQWIAFPNRDLCLEDMAVVQSRRWPTFISNKDLAEITGISSVPSFLRRSDDGRICYLGNSHVVYRICGVFVELIVRWDVSCPAGDSHQATFHGTNCAVEIRQRGQAPDLYIRPVASADFSVFLDRIACLLSDEGVSSFLIVNNEFEVLIPEYLRTGHEAHFADVADHFLHRVRNDGADANEYLHSLLAKYWLTTAGSEAARDSGNF